MRGTIQESRGQEHHGQPGAVWAHSDANRPARFHEDAFQDLFDDPFDDDLRTSLTLDVGEDDTSKPRDQPRDQCEHETKK